MRIRGDADLVELRGLEPLTPCLQISPDCRIPSLTWASGNSPPVEIAPRRMLLWSGLAVRHSMRMSGAWVTVAAMGDVAQAIRLEPWTPGDLSLLRQANTPEMTAHLGGPETEDKLLDRHRRYLQGDDPGAGQMFAVVLEDGQRVGIIGYWERTWHDELVYETGWSVVPAFAGRGIATVAARAVAARARAQQQHKYL